MQPPPSSFSATAQPGQAMHPLTMPSFNRSHGSVLPPEVIEATRRHWCLFPVQRKGRLVVPTGDIEEATSDLDQLELWAVERPGLSWALATGEASVSSFSI